MKDTAAVICSAGPGGPGSQEHKGLGRTQVALARGVDRERQLHDLPLTYDCADVGGFGLEGRHIGEDGKRLGYRAGLQGDVEGGCRVDLDYQSLLLRGFESRRRDSEIVDADLHIGNSVNTGVGCSGLINGAGVCARCCNDGALNDGPRGIENGAGDGPTVGLSQSCACSHKHEEKYCDKPLRKSYRAHSLASCPSSRTNKGTPECWEIGFGDRPERWPDIDHARQTLAQ